ncbi:uncharacterized protein [Branchiostoma lanceolatum]|uniref:uncharacterized protein isoform X4 n=1 Tax=Branchiostoma lanceolatum TaxID=7740 RepID=UPI003451D543
MASRSWFDRTNDDVTAWWFRDLIRRGVISDRAEHSRQRRRPNRFKRWLLLERRRGLRKHRYFALVVEVGLSLAVIGLLIGLTLHVIGPVLFGIGCFLLIPSAFWFVWEFSYRTTEELEVRHMPRESDDENEDEVNERNTTDDSVNRSREGVREDLPSVRDGGQIQVVVPSPPPYEEVTSQDRRHLGNQSEASDAPRPPPYASVAEVDERTRQQTSRTEEPRSSEQCPSYTEAIRSPTSGSPTDEMPSELPPVPPPAYEEVVNR